jgi:hypothetical protein
VTEGLESKDDVVDEKVAVRLPDLVPTSDVVENGISGARSSSLEKQEKLNFCERT